MIQHKTAAILADQEKDILRVFNTKLTELKKELEEERRKKGADSGNFEEK